MIKDVFDISRLRKRLVMMSSDFISIIIAVFLSQLTIRADDLFSIDYVTVLLLLLTSVSSIWLFWNTGVYTLVTRYMGQKANILIFKSIFLSCLLYVLFSLALSFEVTLISLLFYLFTMLLLVAGTRFIIRAYYYQVIKNKKENVAIYGAGVSGLQLVTSLFYGHEYETMAFIDDDVHMHNANVHGVKVYPPTELENIIKKFNIDCILIAMPSINRVERNKIISLLEKYPVHIKTIPNSSDLISGKKSIKNLQEVDIEDLLGRTPIKPDECLLGACIKEKVVMITGAGGSIGSELCRQVVQQKPHRVILIESSEYSLYTIHSELVSNSDTCEIIPFLCSVRDKERLKIIISTYGVQTIYHAAAFKHVPMVEHNVIDGVINNIFGTLNVAQAAIEFDVESMVLISTDKAVRPTNVMGVTKRYSELILQALSETTDRTKLSMVRFGNVLGSSGSVVPLFREQIKNGGPVTVTHPDIIRYFMTIPEAVQLVIQAGSMAVGGDVFVLDMGEPVKISDLAKRLIKLTGHDVKSPKHKNGIEITYSGLRPGEKLYEELLVGDEESQLKTSHPLVMRAKEVAYSWVDLSCILDEIKQACVDNDYPKLIELLKGKNTGYKPEREISDYLYVARH